MARIIKSGETSEAKERERLNRSRIIDKDTFNAQLVAREMVSESEKEKHAKLQSAYQSAEEIETQAYQTAMDSAHRACLAELIRSFRDLETLLEAGQREMKELSREIIHKIAGDRVEIPEGSCGLAARTLRVEASSNDFHKLKMLQLPFWVEPSESTRADSGKLIIETETFMIKCSFEEIMTALNLSVQDG